MSISLVTTRTNLRLSRFPLVTGNANIIEQSMKLSNDGGDLRGQVARVHHAVSSKLRLPGYEAHFNHLRKVKAEP